MSFATDYGDTILRKNLKTPWYFEGMMSAKCLSVERFEYI